MSFEDDQEVFASSYLSSGQISLLQGLVCRYAAIQSDYVPEQCSPRPRSVILEESVRTPHVSHPARYGPGFAASLSTVSTAVAAAEADVASA